MATKRNEAPYCLNCLSKRISTTYTNPMDGSAVQEKSTLADAIYSMVELLKRDAGRAARQPRQT